jgi:hypothetical protein
MRVLSCLFALLLLVSAVAVAGSGDVDFHLNSSPDRALFVRSTFAHGFIHGYEEGFHVGDLDLQLGQASRPLNAIPESRQTDYRHEFGSHHDFAAGYSIGFSAGYNDAASGHEFHAAQLLGLVAEGMPQAQPAQPVFGEGFTNGVLSGMAIPSGSAVTPAVVAKACRRSSDSHRADNAIYCDAFARGFAFARQSTATQLANRN